MAEAAELKSPPGMKADVWQYFGFKRYEDKDELDRTKAVCKLCQIEVKYSGNTTNLRNHLSRHHADTAKPVANQTALEKAFGVKFPSNSKRALSITEGLGIFISKDLRPYSVVENAGFKLLIKRLEPRYVLPSRKHLSETVIPQMYAKSKDTLAHSLKSAERVALTCDCWTSRNTVSYLTITCHHIDEEWRLASSVLQTRAVETSHTASNLADLLTEAIQEWGITDKNPAIVTDNAAKIVRAEQLMGHFHMGCFAHLINLASQAGLKTPAIARLLGRVRRIVAFFHRSPTASHTLKEKQQLFQLPQHKLIVDVTTRWNSSLDMLGRFLEQQPAISAALLSPDVRRRESDICTLTETDITTAEDVVKCLGPMKTATLAISEEASPTMSMVAPLQFQLLSQMTCTTEDSSVIKELKTAVHNNLNSRYEALTETLCVASSLDPRFKTLLFLSGEARDAVFLKLTSEAAHLNPSTDETTPEQEDTSHGSTDVAVPAPTQPKRQKDSSALMALLGSAYTPPETPLQRKTTPTERAEEEVATYRKVPSIPLSQNPLTWWQVHAGDFPLLAGLVKQYLAYPGPVFHLSESSQPLETLLVLKGAASLHST
ncbi:zinc finger BED domain-containing protein 1-like [Thalassophryne amazonica]|uniref:zinc finger BED domain-containing protein 1-like n=1 Tax=Thalassophryne amazonica TaxID=390379 RepID=UPI001471889E|nr:zinc finger BED domain-containing protein 1-like [Thalassophryne amazonica]